MIYAYGIVRRGKWFSVCRHFSDIVENYYAFLVDFIVHPYYEIVVAFHLVLRLDGKYSGKKLKWQTK